LASVTDGQTNSAVYADVDPVKPFLLGGESGFWCVNFEILAAVMVEFCQANSRSSFDYAHRDAFFTQSHDTQSGTGGEPHKIS
jgi:hypothetical protein